MNGGFLQSSSWSSTTSRAPTSSSSFSLWHDDSCQEQELPVSWSQLLLGGSLIDDFETKKLVDVIGWEEDQTVARNASAAAAAAVAAVHRAVDGANQVDPEEIQQLAEAASAAAARASWRQMMNSSNLAVLSSPRSCVTTSFGSSSSMLGFSNSKADQKRHHLNQPPLLLDHSSECNSEEEEEAGAAAKKIRVTPYSAQSTFKVRKEKLGDRVAVLHQMVSPFGKTDTASVLLEAIGYIRFLHSQIEALSSPYLQAAGSGGSESTRQPAVKGRNCIFPEDPGQVDVGGSEIKEDLRSRGLCLVPLSTCMSGEVLEQITGLQASLQVFYN